MSERFRERLRALAFDGDTSRPELDELRRRGRRYVIARRVATVAAAIVVCLALVLPIYALSGLGSGERANDEPAASETAVPTTTDPSPSDASGDVPDVLVVTCTGDRLELGSTRVQAQSDGVHIEIEGDAHWNAELLVRDIGRFDTFGADPGPIVFTLPPGIIYTNCGNRIANDPSDPGVQEFRVVDPNGYWVSDELACDQPVNARGFQADAGALNPMEPTPESAIRDHVPGVLATDEVIPAEYGIRENIHENWGYAWMLVRRDGESLARFQVTKIGEGEAPEWGVHFGDTCPGSGIADG
jgi:hypothetical protein